MSQLLKSSALSSTQKTQFLNQSCHESCKPLNDSQISRIQRGNLDLGKSLFFAIKHQDFEHATQLISIGAPINCTYEIDRDVYRTTVSLLVSVICQIRVSHGHKAVCYKIPSSLLDSLIDLGADLKCHCSSKFEHRCPLFVALKTLKIKNEEELFCEKNAIIHKLIVCGATVKKHISPHKTFVGIPYLDFDGIRSYLLSKLLSSGEILSDTATSHFHNNRSNPLPYQHDSQFSKSGYQFTFNYK